VRAKYGKHGSVVAAIAVFLLKFKFAILLVLTKGKLLLLGLTKLPTLLSMFVSLGFYWSMWGWKFALGFIVSMYIHEMGHVWMLNRYGIKATAPMFVPGFGAFVRLQQYPVTEIEDARVGLAGPLWGLGSAAASYGVYAATGAPIWAAIAQSGAWINLFNLIPVWQLDGSRGFHALSRVERWIVVATIAVALYLTGQRLLFIVGGVAVWRAAQREVGPGDRRVLATFVILVAALSWIAKAVG
jgi:Zn-dependent protease